MTLPELMTALKRYGFDDSDPLAIWLNAAYHEFEDYVDWPFLEVTTSIAVSATINTIALPSDFDRMISVRVQGQSTGLEYYDTRTWFRELPNWTTSANVPDKYTIFNTNQIQLHPVPLTNVTVDLHYLRSLPDLTGNDSPLIPLKHHYVLVRGAAALALQAESNEERAKTAYDQFQGDMDVAANRASSKQLGTAITVQDSQGYAGAD